MDGRSFVNSNDINIKNPLGMFGDQPTNGLRKKESKETTETTQDQMGQSTQDQMNLEEQPIAHAVAVVCLHCRKGFAVDMICEVYCRKCWED